MWTEIESEIRENRGKTRLATTPDVVCQVHGFHIRVNLVALFFFFIKIISDHKSAADPYRSKWHQRKQIAHIVISGKSFIYKSTVINKANKCACSALFSKTEPLLWYFIGASVISVIIWKVPWVCWSLDNGVIGGNTLNTHTNIRNS